MPVKTRQFYNDVKKFANDLAKQRNLDIEISDFNIRDDNFFRFYIRGNEGVINGKSAEQRAFEQYCGSFGFKPEDYGKKYTAFNGDTMKFIGFNPRARKYFYLVKNMLDGKTYKTQHVNIKKEA
jgi:hypothetical protein